MIFDAFLLITLHTVFFAFGWIFCEKMLLKERKINSNLVQAIFSLTISLTCIMFGIVILEILDWFNVSIRHFYWHISVVILLFILMIIIPYWIMHNFFIMIFGSRIGNNSKMHLIKTFLFVIVSYIFWDRGYPYVLDNANDHFSIFSIEHGNYLYYIFRF